MDLLVLILIPHFWQQDSKTFSVLLYFIFFFTLYCVIFRLPDRNLTLVGSE